MQRRMDRNTGVSGRGEDVKPETFISLTLKERRAKWVITRRNVLYPRTVRRSMPDGLVLSMRSFMVKSEKISAGIKRKYVGVRTWKQMRGRNK